MSWDGNGYKAGNRSAAEFVRSHGWKVGDILYGSPIIHDGQQIERARHVRITAIGEETVIGRTRIIGETEWWPESSRDFNSREWRRAHGAE